MKVLCKCGRKFRTWDSLRAHFEYMHEEEFVRLQIRLDQEAVIKLPNEMV